MTGRRPNRSEQQLAGADPEQERREGELHGRRRRAEIRGDLGERCEIHVRRERTDRGEESEGGDQP